MTLLELVTQLRDRYQVYAGEHKKPSILEECHWLIEQSNRTISLGDIDSLFNSVLPKVEFLVHKEDFHPEFILWYQCPDTTPQEMVVLLNECIAILTGQKPWPKDQNNASSVSSIVEE